MTYYLKINSEKIVIDALSFPYEGYIPYETDELPDGAYGGWFKLENGKLVEYPELKPVVQEDEISVLKKENELLQKSLLELTSYVDIQNQRITTQEQSILELSTIVTGGAV